MTKNKDKVRPTRAQKIVASKKAAVEFKKPRRHGAAKPAEMPVEADVMQAAPEPTKAKPAPKPTPTNVVSISKPVTIPQTYAEARQHLAKFGTYIKDAIARLDDPAEYDDWHDRRDAADLLLEELMKRFDHNGFSNPWSRLVMAHWVLDLVHYTGFKFKEAQDAVRQIEQVYRGQKMPEHLQYRIEGLRKRTDNYRKAA